MKTIAVLGGSFSPVHIGHINIARTIIAEKLADEVWLVPCKQNPLKETVNYLSDEERLEFLKRAVACVNSIEGREILKVNDVELTELSSPSYTCNTLRHLESRFPDLRFRIVVGADSYCDFKKWKDWEWIERNFDPIMYPRPGYYPGEPRPGWTFLSGVEILDISSTELREKIRREEDIDEYMPWLECQKIKIRNKA